MATSGAPVAEVGVFGTAIWCHGCPTTGASPLEQPFSSPDHAVIPSLRANPAEYVHWRLVSFTDATITRLPRAIRPLAERHHELIKFAIVGATTFVIDAVLFYTLKLTVLEPKPVTAKVISGIVAVIASYIFNREWSFKDRGGRERHHEALLFFAVSGVGVLLSMAPLWFSSYVLGLRVPAVSLTMENVADFVSAYIVGNLMQMAFRFWAFRRFVFPDEFARTADLALGATLEDGTLAEALEDQLEGGAASGSVVALFRRPVRQPSDAAPSDTASSKASKTS